MKIKPESMAKLHQCKDLLLSIVEDEKKQDISTFENEEDRLRYFLFMLCMKDAVKGVSSTLGAAEQTDTDLRQMCEEEGMTVKKAADNAKMNMTIEVITSLFSNGPFAPPSGK